MNRLKEKVAVVTGGGAGIGQAKCELFAEEGAAVVVAEQNAEAGRETADRITRNGGRAIPTTTDVTDEASVQQMVAEAVKSFGRISILVHNAAVIIDLVAAPEAVVAAG
jgi:NAD(P)-dependent dehydrogenase (short-subunit alcohol dehydrogenase family)